jgi:hypothetical protein
LLSEEAEAPAEEDRVEYIYRGLGSAEHVGGLPGRRDRRAVHAGFDTRREGV